LTDSRLSNKKENTKAARDLPSLDEKNRLQENIAQDKPVPATTHQLIQSDEATAPNSNDRQQKSLEDSKKQVSDDTKQKPVSSSKSPSSQSKANSRWTFGAVYAPDVSTVKFTHTQPMGLNLGLTVEYKLSKKFSLQSGLIYTRKNYKMNGEDYHPPKGSWFDYVTLEDVTGDCSMFDIPLNARFNAVRKKSSNIFVSAGLSTYLMNEENYSYFYYYNSTPTTRERSYDANSQYFFSILNISAGYEKKLTKAFSLQVEPFFKLPLTGLGFGEIDLNSAGVYFSVRYNPLVGGKQTPTVKK
jgi:hypothetical protein